MTSCICTQTDIDRVVHDFTCTYREVSRGNGDLICTYIERQAETWGFICTYTEIHREVKNDYKEKHHLDIIGHLPTLMSSL